MKTLRNQRWINNQTRAVILGKLNFIFRISSNNSYSEFATYNVNINLFVVATIAAEFIPGL